MVALGGFGGAQAIAALRRPAPARGAGPRAGQPAERAAARRAAGRARPQAARADAGRAEGDPAPGRHHLHLRDPRPGRGALHERPRRRLQPGQDRADGPPAELYEHPKTAFVAGFVGVTNLLQGEAAASITGAARAFSIRPEKIHLAPAGSAAPRQRHDRRRRGREPALSRRQHALRHPPAGGGELTVIEQNRDSPFAPEQGSKVDACGG